MQTTSSEIKKQIKKKKLSLKQKFVSYSSISPYSPVYKTTFKRQCKTDRLTKFNEKSKSPNILIKSKISKPKTKGGEKGTED